MTTPNRSRCLQFKLLVWKILVQTIIPGERMALHAFCPGNSCTHRTHVAVCLSVHPLPGYGFDEFSNTQAATVTGRTFGRQDMVGSGGFISVCDRGFLAQKERAVVAEVGQPPFQI